MRRLLLIAVLTLTHLALSAGLGLFTFATGMARFDHGGAPPLRDRVADLLVRVLLFPVADPLARLLPLAIRGGGFPWEHLIFVANSLLWAVVLVALWTRRSRWTSSV